MPEPVKKSNKKIAQTRSLHWMEEAHLIRVRQGLGLAWVIGMVMVIVSCVIHHSLSVWDDMVFWIGVVIWISAWGLTFAMRGFECILKCLPKSRAHDRRPTNYRATDEGTNWTISLDPTLVPKLQNKDKGLPRYEDIESQDALHLPKFHECCSQEDTIVYESESP